MNPFQIVSEKINYFFDKNINWINLPDITIYSLLELFILTIIIYKIFEWVKTRKIYNLLKGVVFLFVFYLLANIFNFYTFIWIFNNTTMVLIICIVIAFQPEIRKVLESLGERKFQSIKLLENKNYEEKISDKSIIEIINAVNIMSKAKTGALILIEQNNSLYEYEKTGIYINADITSQLLINIFENNTPLHDGALIIENNKIISATCYLPLSETKVNKSLGTRHRAALGISEITDCLVIIVSEETGNISISLNSKLYHNISLEELNLYLEQSQQKKEIVSNNYLKRGVRIILEKIKGEDKNEK